jgi:hypothetical protein
MPTEIDEHGSKAQVDANDAVVQADDIAEETEVRAEVHIPNENDDDDDEAVIAEDVEMDDADVDDDDKDDDDQEEVLAAVVVEDDDDDVNGNVDSIVAEDIVEAEPVVAVINTPKRKVKSPAKAISATSNRSKSNSTNKQPTTKQSTSSTDTRKAVNKKNRQSGTVNSNPNGKPASIAPVDEIYKSLPARKVTAARDARSMLRETVTSLPVSIGEAQVRSFGQLCIQSMPSSAVPKASNEQQVPLTLQNPYHTFTSLYPIGFSCDRYELSPVHGRMLKIRCSILDGQAVKATQKLNGFAIQSELPDGPVFRIMWGRGIDEDLTGKNDSLEHPFEIYAHSTPIVSTGSVKNDALISNAVKSTRRSSIVPKIGMRVKVSCDKDHYFTGTIATVGEPKLVVTNGKKKRKRYDIIVHYDDGLKEEMLFPDPDLELISPGTYYIQYV